MYKRDLLVASQQHRVPNQCSLCGVMKCGCIEHFNPIKGIDTEARFSLCINCEEDITARCGQVYLRYPESNDGAVVIKWGNSSAIERVFKYLEDNFE